MDSYGTVEIVESANNVFDFTVDANDDLNSGALPNFGIQDFGFNSNLTLLSSYFSLPTGWDVDLTGSTLSKFGVFYADTSGKGNTRHDPLTFTLTIPTATIADVSDFYVANAKGYQFAAHIADIGPYGDDSSITSAWFAGGPPKDGGGGTPVPEPATMILMGIGMLGIGVGARRRTSKKS